MRGRRSGLRGSLRNGHALRLALGLFGFARALSFGLLRGLNHACKSSRCVRSRDRRRRILRERIGHPSAGEDADHPDRHREDSLNTRRRRRVPPIGPCEDRRNPDAQADVDEKPDGVSEAERQKGASVLSHVLEQRADRRPRFASTNLAFRLAHGEEEKRDENAGQADDEVHRIHGKAAAEDRVEARAPAAQPVHQGPCRSTIAPSNRPVAWQASHSAAGTIL